MKSVIIFVSFLAILNLQSVLCDDKPEYKCVLSGTICTFSSIRLNSTHYEWQPTSDDPTVVRTLTFSSCIIPVITKDICKTFPMITRLNMANQGVDVVHEDAFFDCKRLEYIDLQQNRIEKLEKQTFYYNTAVQTLLLYLNKIMSLNEFAIFENMQSLVQLHLGGNNITDFSPELIRNNKLLQELYIFSNDILDIDAEKIVELLPNLTRIDMDDNEISCWRLSEIAQYLTAKGVSYGIGHTLKTRYYSIQSVYGSLRCNPDASWMAADYRVENSKFVGKFEAMERKLLTNADKSNMRMEQKLLDLDAKIDKMEKMLMKLVQSSKN